MDAPGLKYSPIKRGWPSDLYAKACRTTAVGHSGVMVSLEGILQLSSHVVVECTASAFGLGGDGLALATRLAPPVEPSAAIGPATIRTPGMSWEMLGLVSAYPVWCCHSHLLGRIGVGSERAFPSRGLSTTPTAPP